MCTSQLDRDTLLAVDVVTQVERMIQERWGVEGNTLIDQIRALRTRKVDSFGQAFLFFPKEKKRLPGWQSGYCASLEIAPRPQKAAKRLSGIAAQGIRQH